MVSKNIIKQPKSVIEVQITVPWADIEPKWSETLGKLSAEIELPGFRKGQAPAGMVESRLGTKLPDEVLKVVMPQALIEALQGTNVVPIDYPKYQLVSFAKGQQLAFKATVTERPQVKVGDYKGIKAQRPAIKTITDADVDKVIDDLFKRWKARPQAANAPATPAAGTSIGSVSFNQTPAQAPVSQSSSQAPDDNFAKAVGAQSLADLRAKIKVDLEAEAKYNNELDFEEAILQEVEKLTTVEIPEILIEDELNRMLVSLQGRVADMGLLLDDYLKSQGKTLEGIKQEWRAQAEKNVRMELGLSEVARMESIQISEEEVQAEVNKIQDAKLKARFQAAEPRLHLKHSLRQLRTLDLLKTLVKTAA